MVFSTRPSLRLEADQQGELAPMFRFRSGQFSFGVPAAPAAPTHAARGREPSSFSLVTLPLACMSSQLLGGRPQQARDAVNASQTILEKKTGTQFPLEFTLASNGKSKTGELAGLGVRSKKIAGIKNIDVYTLGLYVDPFDVRRAMGKYKGKEADSLVSDQGFYGDFLEAKDVTKTMRLVVTFGRVTQANFVAALQERILPPLQQAGKPELMTEFSCLFDGVKFKKGTEITFSTKAGMLHTAIDGQQRGPIASPVLCSALFGVWIGEDAVSKDAKESIGQGLARMLSQ